ncbi:hypothetical protein VNI00_008769 [Paramarasmius palmivorus]|uniref:Phosphoglycerate mutase-like protein n=1 Tax=Paramarasmius palmivorus TaxID=297713 RepID=A0AAW0CW33_9AGAR
MKALTRKSNRILDPPPSLDPVDTLALADTHDVRGNRRSGTPTLIPLSPPPWHLARPGDQSGEDPGTSSVFYIHMLLRNTLFLHCLRLFILLQTSLTLHLATAQELTDTSSMSTNGEPQKFQSPLDVEKYPGTPEGLNLEQVHIYVRHGERTPVGVRMADQPANIPEQWIMCKTARRMQASVHGMPEIGDQFLESRKIVERKDGTSMPGECLLGELTDLGRKSTYDYGTSLRKLYIDKLGFLPDTLEKADQVYFRTTNMPRTTESLQHIIHGLYPTSKCHPNAIPPILVRNGRDENLIGNTSNCKRLEVLLVGFAQGALFLRLFESSYAHVIPLAAASAFNPTLEPLDKKLSKYIGGKPVRVDGKPRASGIMDTIRAAAAHNIKVPPEFEDKGVVDTIERAVIAEWFSDKTEEVRRLGMGRLLDDLSRKIQHKVEYGEKDPLKVLVHATHDTGLAALCSTLDVFDEKWPAFTASITFELFKRTADPQSSSIMQTVMSPFRTMTKPEYFVRMRYQNKNMVLPMCADEGKHLSGSPEFCTLTAFRERIKELTPVDWDAECAPGGRASR